MVERCIGVHVQAAQGEGFGSAQDQTCQKIRHCVQCIHHLAAGVMFSVLSRSIPRRTLVQSVRYVSQNSTVPPKKKVKSKPKAPPPETEATANTEPSPAAPEPTSPLTGVPTLDFSPPEFQKESQTTGAKSSKGSLSSSERKRRFMGRVSLVLLALAFTGQTVYLGREWEEDELKAKKLVRAAMSDVCPFLNECYRNSTKLPQRVGEGQKNASLAYLMFVLPYCSTAHVC